MTKEHTTEGKLAARDAFGSLRSMTSGELRVRWRELFGGDAPSSHPEFLRRRIAFRLQEKREGGLSPRAKARLEELLAEVPIRIRRSLPEPPRSRAQLPRDPRIPPPGHELVRLHRGEMHRVQVVADGFTYRGKRFQSLSAVAREITGQQWNGLRFFRLTTSEAR